MDETIEDVESKPRSLQLRPQRSSEDPKKLKVKLNAKEEALKQAKKQNEIMRKNVTEDYKMKQEVQALRDAGYQFVATDRAEKKYNPKWISFMACKNWLVNAFDDKKNEDFNDICVHVSN